MRFLVAMTPRARVAIRVAKRDLPRGLRRMIGLVPQQAAAKMTERVVESAPEPLRPLYVRLLRPVRTAGGSAAVLGRGWVPMRSLTESSGPWAVYLFGVDPNISRSNPWTISSMPAQPPAGASMLARRISRREAARIERRKQKEGVVPAGLSEISGAIRRDVEFEALRYEFGLAGFPAVAHWRPALGKVMLQDIPQWIGEAWDDWMAALSRGGRPRRLKPVVDEVASPQQLEPAVRFSRALLRGRVGSANV